MDALSVGVPIRASGDQVVAALSLVVHAEGAQPATLAAAVRAAGAGSPGRSARPPRSGRPGSPCTVPRAMLTRAGTVIPGACPVIMAGC